MASVGVKSSTYILHLNVMQRSSDLISSVKGNGSSMKRCTKDSKMCVCKYNPDWHVLKITHVWVWPKWFWQTHNIFWVIFLNWFMLVSSGSSVISCPRWRSVESHISWNSLFLSANWFILMLYWMWQSSDIPGNSDTKSFLDCTKSLLGKSLLFHINVFSNAYDIWSVPRDCFGWISGVEKLWISYAVSVSLKQHCFWEKIYFGWHIIHYIIIGFIQTAPEKKSLFIKLIRSACTIILLSVFWTVLSSVCSKFFCASAISELTQRCTNHRIGRTLVKLSGMSSAVWLTLSSWILNLARFLIHGSRSSATWQAP